MSATSYGIGDWQRASVERIQLDAGPGQIVVLFTPPDTGEELSALALATAMSEDAARLAGEGWRIMTSTAIPLRHTGVMMGRNGSGYASKISLLVVSGALLGS